MNKTKALSGKKNKYVVWALFDDAESSYKKSIKKHFDGLFEVHSIGINNKKFKERYNYFYHRIDLSLINFNLIDELKRLPKPDIIMASPPCESWSGADCNGKMLRSINEKGRWIVKNSKYYDNYNKSAHPVKRRYFEQKEKGRILGESTIGACIEIIRKFNPKIWIIENPQTSKSWVFQENHWNFLGNINKTYYSSYDSSFSKKPTIFKSNIDLELKKNKSSSNSAHMAHGNYNKRSSIPLDLIKDIIEQTLKKLKDNYE